MSIAKASRLGALVLSIAMICPQKSQAETFTSAEFLKWKQVNQESYFRINIAMASLIAAQNNKEHARCLEEWYYVDQRRARDYILKTMREHSDYHPQGVLLAIMKQECGSFDYDQRGKVNSR